MGAMDIESSSEKAMSFTVNKQATVRRENWIIKYVLHLLSLSENIEIQRRY